MPALHALMAEQLLAESVRSPRPGEAWPSWLREVFLGQRRRFLSHRDSGKILANTPPTDLIRDGIMPTLTAPLMAAGLASEDAIAAAGGLASLLLGWVIYAQNEGAERYIESMIDPDAGFAFALDVFIEGLVRRAARAHSPTADSRLSEQLQNLWDTPI